MTRKRQPISKNDKKTIWDKTGGLCHFCGKKLSFDAKRGDKGRWHSDHILPLSLEGKNDVKNYLPICNVCNRLKCNFGGKKIRDLLRYGIIAYKEGTKKSKLGIEIKSIYDKKMEANKKRRKGDIPDEYYN
jgi:5-methylcytosine-specific restriction endonuclease McrA